MLRLSVVIHCGYYRLRAAVEMICWTVESSCCQLRLSVEISVVISCSGCQSRWSVGISWQRICCGQLLWRWDYQFRLSLVISCWDYLLRAAVEIIFWDYLSWSDVEIISCDPLWLLSVESSCGDDLLNCWEQLLPVEIICWDFCCDQLFRLPVKMICWDQLTEDLLWSAVVKICCDQPSRLSVESSCLEYLSRAAGEIIYWDYVLWSAEIICCFFLLWSAVAIISQVILWSAVGIISWDDLLWSAV